MIRQRSAITAVKYGLSDKLTTVRVSTLLKVYLFLNVYKAVIGIALGKSAITAFTLLILLFVFGFLFFKKKDVERPASQLSSFTVVLIILLFVHFVYSLVGGESTLMIATFTALMQLLTPLILIYVVKSVDQETINSLARFLLRILFPVILIGLLEFLTPMNIRIKIYTTFNALTTGSSGLNVAYYFGDSAYEGLRLGSIFFDPLTFGFVSSFYLIYKLVWQRKRIFMPLIVNILSLGKLPLFTTLIAGFNKLVPKFISKMYYLSILLVVAAFFVINFKTILLNFPSMANHLIGLSSGILNGLEKPFLGHGLGTAGYVSYMLYVDQGLVGPFYREIHYFNGNESSVGMMIYQLGFVLSLIYLLFIILIFLDVHSRNSKIMAGCVFAYFISLFLSESVLGVTVVSTLLIFCYAKPERN